VNIAIGQNLFFTYYQPLCENMQNLDQNRIKNSRQKVENNGIFQVEILVKKAPSSKSKNKLKKSAESDQNIFHPNNNFSWCNGVTSSSPDLGHFLLLK
jgi:hypothetical protein